MFHVHETEALQFALHEFRRSTISVLRHKAAGERVKAAISTDPLRKEICLCRAKVMECQAEIMVIKLKESDSHRPPPVRLTQYFSPPTRCLFPRSRTPDLPLMFSVVPSALVLTTDDVKDWAEKVRQQRETNRQENVQSPSTSVLLQQERHLLRRRSTRRLLPVLRSGRYSTPSIYYRTERGRAR